MDKRKVEEMCRIGGMEAMDALLDVSDEIVGDNGRMTSDDIYELKCIWSAISHIKTCLAMDEGGNALRRFMK